MIAFTPEEATAIALLLMLAGVALGVVLSGVALYTAQAMRRHYAEQRLRNPGRAEGAASGVMRCDPAASFNCNARSQIGQHVSGVEFKVTAR